MERAQTSHEPPHALSQQTVSEQKPVAHWFPAEQVAPRAFLG